MDVVRYLLPDLAAGCLGGAAAAGGVFVATVDRLRDLIPQTQAGWLAGLLLSFEFVSIFSATAIARAVPQIGEHKR